MAKTTHGLREHPLYKTWCEMRYRCNNPAKWNYQYYGARGIRVCERWAHFENFLADMGERPEGHTLDRINVLDDYAPENCRWASAQQQANNKDNNRLIQYADATLTLAEWARASGLRIGTIWKRLNDGWSIEDALTTPKYGRRTTA